MNALLFEWQMVITFHRYHLNRMWDHPFSTYLKFSETLEISYPLIRKKYYFFGKFCVHSKCITPILEYKSCRYI